MCGCGAGGGAERVEFWGFERGGCGVRGWSEGWDPEGGEGRFGGLLEGRD